MSEMFGFRFYSYLLLLLSSRVEGGAKNHVSIMCFYFEFYPSRWWHPKTFHPVPQGNVSVADDAGAAECCRLIWTSSFLHCRRSIIIIIIHILLCGYDMAHSG